MAFGGTIGASGNLIPANLLYNIKGEQGASYDADGRLAFTTADGVVYTPERVDTLVLPIGATEVAGPLKGLVAGSADPANGDTGALTTAAPVVNQNGLPTNFGPGRGKWNSIGPASGPFSVPRLRVAYETDVVAPAQGFTGQGSVMTTETKSLLGGDVESITRNFFGQDLSNLVLIIECLHSIQG